MRAELVQQYKDGVAKVTEALTGATDAELDARPAPDKWTAREIVHHLADSEMTSAIRLRRLIAEDKPVIVGYDQEEFTRRLHYDRPIEASMRAFAAARETTGELLDRLSEAEWAREGTHSESGHYTSRSGSRSTRSTRTGTRIRFAARVRRRLRGRDSASRYQCLAPGASCRPRCRVPVGARIAGPHASTGHEPRSVEQVLLPQLTESRPRRPSSSRRSR